MYSKLWAASGVDYPTLVDRLIALAIERHARQAAAQDERVLTRIALAFATSHFVLDTVFLSSIIYILRENESLSPAIGYRRADEGSAEFDAGGMRNGARREPAPFFCSTRCQAPATSRRTMRHRCSATKRGRCACRSACRKAATLRRSRQPRAPQHVKGGTTDNGEESSQGRQEKGRQEAVSRPPVREKGAIVAPFFFVIAALSAVPDPHALDHVPLIVTADRAVRSRSRPGRTPCSAPSRCGCGDSVMKNWLPPVSGPASAMPTVPRTIGQRAEFVANRVARARPRRRRADRPPASRSSAPAGAPARR